MSEKNPLLSPLAESFHLEAGPHAVLLIHGFTGSPAHMRPLGAALHQAGMTAFGVRLKGHGTSIRDMMACTWQDWLQNAEDAFQWLADRYETVSVCGLSMGGVLSLILAEEHREVNACVTLSAPMGMANRMGPYGHLVAPFMPIVHKKNGPAKELLDPVYDIGYDDIPTARCHDLDILIKLARDHLGAVSCPLLCLQSEQDRTITADSADIILGRVTSVDRRRVTLKTSPHVITIGPEQGLVHDAVTRFLLEQTGGKEA